MTKATDVIKFWGWWFKSWKRFCVLCSVLACLAIAKHAKTEPMADLIETWEKVNPWAEEPPPPPEQKPFELPRLYADDTHFNAASEPLKKAPKINPDTVYLTVMKCFPAKSTFNAELSLVAGYKTALDEWDSDYPDIADHYVGVVGKIPLYSANERSRQREREYQRRNVTAQHVAGFIAAIASRNQAWREIGLYRSLEARAQARVKKGIAETNEQVTYLEKLTQSHANLITQQSKITEYRLALSGLCENAKREPINNWLIKLTQLQR